MRKALNILWDVDNEKDLVGLPNEIDIPDTIEDMDEIDDYISNVTGFCHSGYELLEDDDSTDGKEDDPAISDFVLLKGTGKIVLVTGIDEGEYTIKDRFGNVSTVKKEDIEAVEYTYKIPITWEMCGEIAISARSAKKALEKSENSFEYIELPYGEYVDASLRVTDMDTNNLHAYQYPWHANI